MSLFEAQVETIRSLVRLHAGTHLAKTQRELPARGVHAGLILQNETLCELGGSSRSSALTLVYTNASGKDCAFKVGNAPNKLDNTHADFALAVILGGEKLDAETFYQFTLRFPRLADHPGWMVKVDKSKIWVRVGRTNTVDALELAAASLISRIHSAFETVDSVELYFVIDDKPLVEQLLPIAETCQKLMRDLKTGVWQTRGFDYESCQLTGHCGSCSDKKTCASVRKIQAKVNFIRKTNSKDQ